MNAAGQINRSALLDVDEVRSMNASIDLRAVASSVKTEVVHASGVMTAEQEASVVARSACSNETTVMPDKGKSDRPICILAPSATFHST